MTRTQGLGLFLITALAGCMSRTGGDDGKAHAYDPVTYRDRVTGCEHLATGNAQSLTPRLRADGSQVCGAPKE